MAKQQTYQKYVLKIHSKKILKNNRNLNLSLAEMRRDKMLISLTDSQTLRFIDEINNIDTKAAETLIKNIRKEIKDLQRKLKTAESTEIKSIKIKIKSLYSELDNIQNKPDYLAVVMDRDNDIYKLDKGFKINGLLYKRLVGTANGVKKSTVVYVSEKSNDGNIIYDVLNKRLENERNPDIPLVPAKYESYKSLACSASIPVSMPQGILVVDDVILKFQADVIELNDKDSDETQYIEPTMEEKNTEVELDNSDGYGLILPCLAERWSKDLNLNYTISGCCTRNSFLKGMFYTFDFRDFANKFNCNKLVQDVWGNFYNIDEVEMIVTTSMLKLWDCYSSLEHYMDCCERNHYSFAVTKACPEFLENERTLNYQFIQSYDLTDNQIEELIAPTVDEIKDVLGGDINKTILFLRGVAVTEDTADLCDDDCIKALMIDDRMINDPYVIDRINNMIKKRITDAKIGVVKVSGNYAMISGDPFALCQHIFKTNIDENGNDIVEEMGLLKAGEIYSKHWVNKQVPQVVCFRAPMTCHNNIRIMNIIDNQDVNYWYQYMSTVNIVNCHDTMAHALNGFDEDGDTLMTTDNPILLQNTRPTPAIMCIQRKADKKIITDDMLIKANMDGFGDEIGSTTNRITSMIDVLAAYEKGSKEYKILDYRIKCGQLYQQNCIDRVKGIVAKPMPKYWYTPEKILDSDSDELKILKKFNNSIIADKKPYFMNYIYPQQKEEYNKYIKITNKKCLRTFKISVQELIDKQNKTDKEKDFLKWYYWFYPVSDNNCVMNRLCHIVENHFNGFVSEIKNLSDFDYSILKSQEEYKKSDYIAVKKIYTEYQNEIANYMITAKKERIKDEDKNIFFQALKKEYRRKCISACADLTHLTNIVVDLCYTNAKSKQFAWDICGEVIIQNLLKNNGGYIYYLTRSDTGEIIYGGNKFTKLKKKIGVDAFETDYE